MSKTNERRSPCPVACMLDLVGDRWTLLVVRDLACGKKSFRDFLRSPEKVATNILTDRLNRLVEHGLVERYLPEEANVREAYRLTEKGKTLIPVLQVMVQWGLEHLEGTEAKMVMSSQ